MTNNKFTASYLTDVMKFEHKIDRLDRNVYRHGNTFMVPSDSGFVCLWSIWRRGELVYVGKIDTISFFEDLIKNIGIVI